MAARNKSTNSADRMRGSTSKQYTQTVQDDAESTAEGEPESSGLSRRPKRHAQRVGKLQEAEEEAQILMAIKLSLNEQKKQKKAQLKIKVGSEINGELKVPENPSKEPKAKKPRRQKPRVKDAESSSSSNPAKVHHKPTKPRIRKHMMTVDRNQADSIPSTTSFISYVLQQSAANRDMSLVKLFESQP